MGTKRHKSEDVVAKPRQVVVLVSQGHSVGDAIHTIVVTEGTSDRWRKECGGLKGDQIRHVKDLQTENQQLWEKIADLTLDKLSGAPGYTQPAPKVFAPAMAAWVTALAKPAQPAKLHVERRPTPH